ncbi:MAG: porphobilinogen synthase [Planctomycetes bacterium]|nr:porphobilinogen synthase [Planctomycetota bacterium]MCW8137166.1 porphobilinogen synthase [Planctomycetota bacterium]
MDDANLPIRPRRNRKSAAVRGLVRETRLSREQLIYPVFLHEDEGDTPLASLPGVTRWGLKGLLAEAGRAHKLGINAIVLFPKVPDGSKTPDASEALNRDGLIPRAIKAIKDKLPGLCVITDIALDPYNSDGHDGIVREGKVVNDETVEVLCRQALIHAAAGADIVAPSDMMDGRVAAIRGALDDEGHSEVSILAYTAKYASAFYGPFRGALDSAPKAGDKKTYQMDPANIREAVREAQLDEAEGADMLMVKPAGPYLDVISAVRDSTTLPVAAYQVSGEYLMLKAAAQSGWLDEKACVLESVTGIVRAGADMVLTYHAPQIAEWL